MAVAKLLILFPVNWRHTQLKLDGQYMHPLPCTSVACVVVSTFAVVPLYFYTFVKCSDASDLCLGSALFLSHLGHQLP
jgi:hypothetical protein